MANDYSQFQGSDYYHLTKSPKQNNLVDGLNAALQTFIAIRSGKAKIDRENQDRATKEKYLGEDRAMAKEKFEMEKADRQASTNYKKKQAEYYGQAKPLTEEAKAKLVQETEVLKAKVASMSPEDPERAKKISEIEANIGLINAKTAQTEAETGGTMPAPKLPQEKIDLLKSQTARNNSLVGADGKPVSASGTKSSKSGHSDAIKSAMESYKSLGKIREDSLKKSEAMLDKDPEATLKNDPYLKDALESTYTNLKEVEDTGGVLSKDQIRILRKVEKELGYDKPQVEAPTTADKDTVDPLKAAPSPLKPLSLRAKESRVSLSSPLTKIAGAELQEMPIDSMNRQQDSRLNSLMGGVTMDKGPAFQPKTQNNFKAPSTPNMLENKIVNSDSPNVEKAKTAWNFIKSLAGGVGEEVGKAAESAATEVGKYLGDESQELSQRVRGNSKESIKWVKSIGRNTQGLVNEMNKIVDSGDTRGAQNLYKKYVNADGTSEYLAPEGIKALESIMRGEPVYEPDPVKRATQDLFNSAKDSPFAKEREAEEKLRLKQEQDFARNKNAAYLRGKSG